MTTTSLPGARTPAAWPTPQSGHHLLSIDRQIDGDPSTTQTRSFDYNTAGSQTLDDNPHGPWPGNSTRSYNAAGRPSPSTSNPLGQCITKQDSHQGQSHYHYCLQGRLTCEYPCA